MFGALLRARIVAAIARAKLLTLAAQKKCAVVSAVNNINCNSLDKRNSPSLLANGRTTVAKFDSPAFNLRFKQ